MGCSRQPHGPATDSGRHGPILLFRDEETGAARSGKMCPRACAADGCLGFACRVGWGGGGGNWQSRAAGRRRGERLSAEGGVAAAAWAFAARTQDVSRRRARPAQGFAAAGGTANLPVR